MRAYWTQKPGHLWEACVWKMELGLLRAEDHSDFSHLWCPKHSAGAMHSHRTEPVEASGQTNLPTLSRGWGWGQEVVLSKSLILLFFLVEEVPTIACVVERHTVITVYKRFLRATWLNLCNSGFSLYLHLFWVIPSRNTPLPFPLKQCSRWA